MTKKVRTLLPCPSESWVRLESDEVKIQVKMGKEHANTNVFNLKVAKICLPVALENCEEIDEAEEGENFSKLEDTPMWKLFCSGNT